jgi:hypothetical protein
MATLDTDKLFGRSYLKPTGRNGELWATDVGNALP